MALAAQKRKQLFLGLLRKKKTIIKHEKHFVRVATIEGRSQSIKTIFFNQKNNNNNNKKKKKSIFATP